MAPRIRILCVDDHRIVREGIALIISRQPDMRVVAFCVPQFVGNPLVALPNPCGCEQMELVVPEI